MKLLCALTTDQQKYETIGFYRNEVNGNDDKIYLLEEVNCYKAAAPNHSTQTTRIEADWWHQLDSIQYTNNPCKNGATCFNLQDSYHCECKQGFSGVNCEKDINECEAEPCKNGATCVDLVGDYHCHCVSGFNGANCEKVPKLTTLSPPVTTQPLVIGATKIMKLLFAVLVTLMIRDIFVTVEGSSIKVEIRSEGCNDPDKTPNTCGKAYIKVNDVEHAKQRRGHNVVVVDAVIGIVEDSVVYDTHGNTDAGNQLKGFLNAISGDKIVLVAVQDEGSRFSKDASDALTRMGGYDLDSLDYRGSYALVGHPGEQKPSYVKQVQSKSGQGPSIISMTIPLTESLTDELNNECEADTV
ncbi:Protein crumbs-like 2 [Stylophora pistillata]|uniref:Protein crumbs-like 2 n=2 Tax=Stylophora pistillata TaxID=50429 RepID=A0A2B4SHA0_STYPI|nr:Protein crumbs-like 2 [Stylophora pistillata]